MPRNVEIKARVPDLVSVTAKAKALSGDDGIYMEQVDTFFNAQNGRLKLRCIKKVLANAMGIKGEVIKTRHLIMHEQTRIHIDDVQGLGHFMELEVQLREEQTVEDGEKIAEGIMQELGIVKADLIDGAYMDLLLENRPDTTGIKE
ncbi:hypothetical protein EGW08_005857 [Elysia chlorotica]|uniref:CYTH domain-containing protein n=1 Tax=Elysia chlorotica TaxID=188477 RepID=A0A3S0ZYU9_ELYCH|nr:hypothetical protein EGW08_005857 [Elysia chlorotica]